MPAEPVPVDAPPEGLEPPATDEAENLEVFEGEGFIVVEEEAPEAVLGQVWWGPVSFNGGFVDATSYFCSPISGSVQSRISFYVSPTSGGYVATSSWYTHSNVARGQTVGRRWRGYIPMMAHYAEGWWKGGGVYAGPFRKLW
jgi:hypothetical protein